MVKNRKGEGALVDETEIKNIQAHEALSVPGYISAKQQMSHNSLLKLKCVLLALLSPLIAHENSGLVFDTLITQKTFTLGFAERNKEKM